MRDSKGHEIVVYKTSAGWGAGCRHLECANFDIFKNKRNAERHAKLLSRNFTISVTLTPKQLRALQHTVISWDEDWKRSWTVRIGDDTWKRSELGDLLKSLGVSQ